MAELTMKARNAEFVKSEGNGSISRDEVVIKDQSGTLETGTVLGQVTANGKFTPLSVAASDGSQVAAAILFRRETVNGADRTCLVIARNAEVIGRLLVWPAGITGPQRKTALSQLEALGIVSRD